MIAYVDANHQVYVADPDGARPRLLEAGSKACTWPVWSPGGTHVAFSGMTSGSNGSGHIRLYVHDLGEGPGRAVFANEPGADGIAPSTPHYALWSPNGENLAFVARTWPAGMALFVADLAGGETPKRVIAGAQPFLSWSPDSRFLLVHSGQDHYLLDFCGDRGMVKVPGTSRRYMAPSWSPVTNRMALLNESPGGRQALLTGDTEGGGAAQVLEIDGSAAFAWSPDGGSIGLVSGLKGRSRFYGGLWVVDPDGGGERLLADGLILCFYWSPGGGEIAYITPSERAEGSVRWAIVDVKSGSVRYLADFRPTEEQLTAYMFFDQYVQSHDPWSPGGSSLIFAGALGYHKARAALPPASAAVVLVADADGGRAPTAVAEGFLGFWSPSGGDA